MTDMTHFSMEAWKLKKLESFCRDKSLPFPDNVLKELKELNEDLQSLENALRPDQ